MKKPIFPKSGGFYNHNMLDSDGRVYIPSEIRKILGWNAYDRMECVILDAATRSVCIRPEPLVCCFCGGEEEIHLVKKALVCAACIRELRGR